MNKEVRDLTGSVVTDNNRLEGYGAVYDSPARISERGRSFTEVVKRGAFDRILAKSPDVLVCFNHNPNRLLGRTASGTARVWSDAKGLRFSVDLPDSAADVRELAFRGDLRGCSFMFGVVKERWSKDRSVRELVDLDLFELGPVVQPAYEEAVLSGRSLDLKRLMLKSFEL